MKLSCVAAVPLVLDDCPKVPRNTNSEVRSDLNENQLKNTVYNVASFHLWDHVHVYKYTIMRL